MDCLSELKSLIPRIMKKNLFNKTVLYSILSLAILSFYVFISFGCWFLLAQAMPKKTTTYLGNEIYKTEEVYYRYKEVFTGPRDPYGRLHGNIVIEKNEVDDYDEYYVSTEETVEYVHGWPNGQMEVKHYNESGTLQKTTYECYDMGYKLPECLSKNAAINSESISAYQIMSGKYPWYLRSLNGLGFEDSHVETFLDTIETILSTYEFEVSEFDDYYESAFEQLEGTKYDSIATKNQMLFLALGFEKIKNAEFRLAVVDSRRTDTNTYDVIKSTYPNYLNSYYISFIPDSLFKIFCHDFDSLMISYGPLDTEDPFFVDSVDARFFRALDSLYSYEDNSSGNLMVVKNAMYSGKSVNYSDLRKSISTRIEQLKIDSLSSAMAELVSYELADYLLQGDIVRATVRESYYMNNGIIRIPTVTTKLSENNSDTSADIAGNVIGDGGAEVTERGIVWAVIFNPTISDIVVQSDSGLGEYVVTLNGLSPGTTYYARSYAVNSAGINYGNCIQFTTILTVVDETDLPKFDFTVYPNPASNTATVNFQLESTGNVNISIIDLQGKILYNYETGKLLQGTHQHKIDFSDFENGIYYCRILSEGKYGNKKVMVLR